ncbi:hypothetical protein [Tabrizicola sp. BL-A-41-H6]|uniref:hypothetical protein n=1 Tax=Tabrizicola sp. BL-A-41-H6 TaxID=3421107 RepID=UPI003D67F6FD
MSLTIVFLAAVLTVASGLLFVLRFIRWGTILRFHWLADAIAHIVLFAVFFGTLGGGMTAAIACLIFSILLTLGRKIQNARDLMRRSRAMNAAAARSR